MITVELTPLNRIDLKRQLQCRLTKISAAMNKLLREKESLIRIQEQIERQEQLLDDELLIRCN